MRPDEPRHFDDHDRELDLSDGDQVKAWADRYAVEEAAIREACAAVGPNRTAVELWLGEARP